MYYRPGVSSGPYIEKSSLKDSNSIPAIPVYAPTWDEFKDFSGCISKIESMGAHHIGLCKVIPPEDWKPRPEGYANIDHFVVDKPVAQITHGGRGIFFQEIITRKSMPFREFRSLACSSPYATPTHRDVEHLEKKYWSTINTGRPLYGANVNGTLTTSTTGWNIAQLDSMLSRVLSSENVKIPGVNTPYLYYGMWRATFAWHVEDVDLYSINYVHFGAPKFWYVIPPAYARRFEAFVSEYFRADFVHCNCFLRHKCVLIHPSILEKAGIPTRKIVQNAGEFMINFPYAYHSGFNMGLNVAESTNFALPRWINYGKKAKLCHCWDDTVKICMDPFVRFYQPHLYVDWMKGIDRTPHPLDEYDGLRSTRAAQCTSTPQSKVISKALVPISNSRKSSGDPVLSGPDLNTYLEETAPFEIGDLNNLDVRFVAKNIMSAPPPFHIMNSRLLSLWAGMVYDPQDERRFHYVIGSFEPHCAVCAFLWSPQHFGKVINSLPSNAPLPAQSTPHIPEIAYTPSDDVPTDFDLSLPASSPILRCARCLLTVHAKCYGVQLPHSTSSSAQSPAQSENKSLTTFWHCDACLASTKPRCLLCYVFGGALKPLANPMNHCTGRPYWAHIVCALANPGCRFVDVPRRLAAVSVEAISAARSRRRCPTKRSKVESSDSEPGSRSLSVGNTTPGPCTRTPRRNASLDPGSAEADPSTSNVRFLDALLSDAASEDLFPEVVKAPDSTSAPVLPLDGDQLSGSRKRRPCHSHHRPISGGPANDTNRLTTRRRLRKTRLVCVVCKMPTRGQLPMASCWHDKCPMHYHVTCAQLAGVLIGTDMYPNMFYLACDNHPTTYLQNHSVYSELSVGQEIFVRKPGNPPTFVCGHAVRMVTPMYCRVAFPDGTFSRDTPPEYLLDVDWTHHGVPTIGSAVKVLWRDEVEYTATFQGTTSAQWEVVYRDGKKEILSRDQLFVRQLTPEQQKAHRPASWGIRTCFGGESSSDPVFY